MRPRFHRIRSPMRDKDFYPNCTCIPAESLRIEHKRRTKESATPARLACKWSHVALNKPRCLTLGEETHKMYRSCNIPCSSSCLIVFTQQCITAQPAKCPYRWAEEERRAVQIDKIDHLPPSLALLCWRRKCETVNERRWRAKSRQGRGGRTELRKSLCKSC